MVSAAGGLLPTGAVALVFTDIQGSTEDWERLGDGYRDVLSAHNTVMRDTIARTHGHEVKTEGDAFMIAFAEAEEAVRFTIEAQRALESVVLPDTGEPVRVRMGVHMGEPICEADPITGRMDYFGPVVNRAARVAGAAHGGQTLITGVVRDVASDVLGGARVKDLGDHRLKGLERFERLYEVVPGELADRVFPPVRTLTALPTNLPAQTTSFVGREREWRGLSELIVDASERLITLTGPGGIGKSRLTCRVGDEVLEHFKGGVWFVELEEATTAEGVASRVATALGVPAGSKGPIESVASALEVREPTLLILDNFEQVVDGAPDTVGAWLKRAARTKCLVSSRILLGVSGEREFPLEPLPDAREGVGPYAERDAVRLFVERAQLASPRFELTESNAPDIAEVCAQLDGIPLAIELAAARSKVMKPAQIRDRLAKRFQLLRSTRRDLPGRQQTLEGAIDWSYDLLEEWERSAFVQCCIFRGGFTLESAESVIDLMAFDEAPFPMDAVQTLREKSLLTYSEGVTDADEGRFGMYLSVRAYGAMKRAEVLDDDALADLRARYIEHYLESAEAWDEERRTGSFREALDRGRADVENTLHAHETALETEALDEAVRLILASSTTLALRGPSGRRGPALRSTLDALGEDADPGTRSALHASLAASCLDDGDWDGAASHAQRAVAYGEASGDRLRLGNALMRCAELHRLRGDRSASREEFERARAAFEEVGERAGAARASSGLGSLAWQSGRYDEAIELMASAQRVFESLGNEAGAVRCVGGRGVVLGERGDHEGALAALERAEELYRGLGDRVGLARSLSNKGIELRELGRYDEAVYCFSEAEVLNRQMGRKASMSRVLGSRAGVLAMRGEHEAALVCYEQGEEMQRGMGDTPGVALFVTRRARTLLELARADEAVDAFEQAIAMLAGVDAGEGRIACEAHGWLAHALLTLDRGESARAHARHAESVRASLGLTEDVYGDDAVAGQIASLAQGG